MRAATTRVAACMLSLCASGTQAQQMNMEAMTKWGSAQLIHYRVVGEYRGTAQIGEGGYYGVADVVDRVVMEFDWTLSRLEFANEPKIENVATQSSNLRNPEPTCAKPTTHGPYEHFDLVGAKNGMGGVIALDVVTRYPAIDVPQFCTGAAKAVPAREERKVVQLSVPSPVLLAMGIKGSASLRISDDGNSLISTDKGWIWTFTPSVESDAD